MASTEAKPAAHNHHLSEPWANRRKRIRHDGAQLASSLQISDAGALGPVKEPAQSKRGSQDDLIQLVRELYEVHCRAVTDHLSRVAFSGFAPDDFEKGRSMIA